MIVLRPSRVNPPRSLGSDVSPASGAPAACVADAEKRPKRKQLEATVAGKAVDVMMGPHDGTNPNGSIERDMILYVLQIGNEEMK